MLPIKTNGVDNIKCIQYKVHINENVNKLRNNSTNLKHF